MIANGIIEDSITRFPKNQMMQNEIKRLFLARQQANAINPPIAPKESKVVIGLINEWERVKS